MFKVNIKVVILLICSFISAYLFGGNLPYAIFYIVLLSIIFGSIYVFILLKNLDIWIKKNGEVVNAGDDYKFAIRVENEGIILNPYVLVRCNVLSNFDSKYSGDLISINPLGVKFIDKDINFKRRGIYDIGNITFSLSDIFSIINIEKTRKENTFIKVYPKLYEINNIILFNENSWDKIAYINRGKEDLNIIKDIRKYRTGDSLKRIHWKISAKHNELYVKSFDEVVGEGCNVFIHMADVKDYFKHWENIEESLVDFSVSLIRYLLNNKVNSKIFVNSQNPKTISVETEEEFSEVMEYFVQELEPGEVNFDNFIYYNLKNVTSKGYICIVVLNLSQMLLETLTSLRSIGYKVKVFYYFNNLIHTEDLLVLQEISIECVDFGEIIELAKLQGEEYEK